MVIIRFGDLQGVAQSLGGASTEQVEHVVVPLLGRLHADPGLLQEVVGDEAAHHLVLGAEVDLHELAEARAVVVTGSLGVAKRFQHRVCWNTKYFLIYLLDILFPETI